MSDSAQIIQRFHEPGKTVTRLPEWLRKRLHAGHEATQTDALISDLGLKTICQSGKCPNRNECFSQKTATFMIMGDRCTRNCHYCSVAPGKPGPLNPEEPQSILKAVTTMGLDHVVITSVTRDDLADEGVEHFSQTILNLRKEMPKLIIEVLTPDFRRDPLTAAQRFAELPIDIFNHNIETVRSQHKRVRPQGGYDLSLNLLREVKRRNPKLITKSGAMLGLGETVQEVHQMLADLREQDCGMLTLGQYLQPEPGACNIERFVTPEEFELHKAHGFSIGFDLVESGPYVRSSYHAKDSFVKLKQLLGKA